MAPAPTIPLTRALRGVIFTGGGPDHFLPTSPLLVVASPSRHLPPVPTDRRRASKLSEATQRSYSYLRSTRLSPRVRMAARLYATGAVPTKRAACESVGLHPNVLTMYSAHNPELQALLKEVDQQVAAKAVDMSALLKHLEVKALGTMNKLLTSSTEGMQFKAAQDLLDRGPNTGKVQKNANIGLSIEGDDAKLLAKALFASRSVTEQFRDAVQGDFEKVAVEVPAAQPQLPPAPEEK